MIVNVFLALHSHGLNIGHMVVSSLVHGLIYGAIFKAFYGLSLPVIIGITVIVIGVLWFIFRSKESRL